MIFNTMNEELKTRFANEDTNDIGVQYEIPIDGLFQVYWSNGNLRYEWEYKNGKRTDGKSKGWYESGQLKQTTTWKNNILNGLWSFWWENGQKFWESTFKDGVRNGKHIIWYKTGQKLQERTYKSGEPDGEWTWWDENGLKKDEG